MFAGLKKRCLGASNINRNKTLLHQELSNCEFTLTYTYEDLKKEIHLIYEEMFDIIIIHNLTNVISHICQPKWPKYLKSNSEKEEELYEFADNFNKSIIQTASDRPNTKFFISLCLPRFDQRDQFGMMSGRELVNQKIYNSLHHKKNIILIWNENFSRRDFIWDSYHLNPNGFEKLISNWKNAIGNALFRNQTFILDEMTL